MLHCSGRLETRTACHLRISRRLAKPPSVDPWLFHPGLCQPKRFEQAAALLTEGRNLAYRRDAEQPDIPYSQHTSLRIRRRMRLKGRRMGRDLNSMTSNVLTCQSKRSFH